MRKGTLRQVQFVRKLSGFLSEPLARKGGLGKIGHVQCTYTQRKQGEISMNHPCSRLELLRQFQYLHRENSHDSQQDQKDQITEQECRRACRHDF